MKKGIVGKGGFGRELFYSMTKEEQANTVFFDDNIKDGDSNTFPLSNFDKTQYELIIAIGDSNIRENLVKRLPLDTKYFTFIHPSAQVHDNNIEIGEGSIICAGTIITTNIKIGKHAHLNLLTTIGHDTQIGNYFTTSPGAKISGNCIINDRVYLGTNTSIRQGISICSNVILGLNAGVVKNITEPGVYGGTPAKKIK